MIRKPRCPFCGYRLDEKGRCQHTACADYERTKILEALDKKREEEAAANAAENQAETTAENTNESSQDAGQNESTDTNKSE